jgi:hypothetical protein
MSENQFNGPLFDGLLVALKAIDTQVARELQRTPSQREVHGVAKTAPYQKRVELVASYVLQTFSDRSITLDGILVLAQAFSKAMLLLSEDLDRETLGKVRSDSCKEALEKIRLDCERGIAAISGGCDLN